MSKQFRLNGGLPKVGIRPTIDGRRRGVRESLENQTMIWQGEQQNLLKKT